MIGGITVFVLHRVLTRPVRLLGLGDGLGYSQYVSMYLSEWSMLGGTVLVGCCHDVIGPAVYWRQVG